MGQKSWLSQQGSPSKPGYGGGLGVGASMRALSGRGVRGSGGNRRTVIYVVLGVVCVLFMAMVRLELVWLGDSSPGTDTITMQTRPGSNGEAAQGGANPAVHAAVVAATAGDAGRHDDAGHGSSRQMHAGPHKLRGKVPLGNGGMKGGGILEPSSMPKLPAHARGESEPAAADDPAPNAATLQPPRVSSLAAAKFPVLAADTVSQAEVKDAMMHAWKGYKQYAWGQDNLKPISRSASNNFLGMGATLVDSLDTLLIMGLDEEVYEAEKWINASLHFGQQKDVNLFETTIRVLGGLLAAYDFRGEKLYLERAVSLADALMVAFDTDSGVPYGTVDLSRKHAFNPPWSAGASTMAEVATLQLEWEQLSLLTGDPKYAAATRKIMLGLKKVEPLDGLYPMFIRPKDGQFHGDQVTLGARGDSLYEYLLKQWVLAGGLTDPDLPAVSDEPQASLGGKSPRQYFQTMLEMFDNSAKGIEDFLLKRSKPSGYLYVAERIHGEIRHKMDHLVCFLPGLFALSSMRPSTPSFNSTHHLYLARELMATCYQFYAMTPLGLSPEIARFHGGGDPSVDIGAKHCLLRPETVESLMVLYRVTGDELYRKWGRDILAAINKHARVDAGFTSIKDVTSTFPLREDNMESFFLAETLKYLYLLFSDSSLIPLDQFVFNTEAHPIRIFTQAA